MPLPLSEGAKVIEKELFENRAKFRIRPLEKLTRFYLSVTIMYMFLSNAYLPQGVTPFYYPKFVPPPAEDGKGKKVRSFETIYEVKL